MATCAKLFANSDLPVPGELATIAASGSISPVLNEVLSISDSGIANAFSKEDSLSNGKSMSSSLRLLTDSSLLLGMSGSTRKLGDR